MLISIIEIDYLISYQLCMTWLNWSLKLHSGLRTIPHLTLTHNTQVFDSMNAYLICVIVYVQMWCVCSNTWWSNLKRFLSVLFVFESVYVCFGSLCLTCFIIIIIFFLLRVDFESSKCFLDLWLCCMLDCIHICIFLSWKTILSNLVSFLIPLDSYAIYRAPLAMDTSRQIFVSYLDSYFSLFNSR